MQAAVGTRPSPHLTAWPEDLAEHPQGVFLQLELLLLVWHLWRWEPLAVVVSAVKMGLSSTARSWSPALVMPLTSVPASEGFELVLRFGSEMPLQGWRVGGWAPSTSV